MKSKICKSSKFRKLIVSAFLVIGLMGTTFAQSTQNIGHSGYRDTPNAINDNENSPTGISGLKAYYSAGMINISFEKPASEIVKIEIYDLTGRLIINDIAPCTELKTARTYSVSSLSNGLYIVRVSSSTQVFSRKFFV